MKTNKLLWIGIPVLAILGWAALGRSASHERVDSKTAHALVQAGARLVDVRTPAEFAAQHIPGAINIPLQQLPARVNELAPKDRGIVLYCRSGHRSGMAYDQLKAAGFTRLSDLGPMAAW